MNTKAKGKPGTELKTTDDLGAISLNPGAHHTITYTGDEGGSITLARAEKGEDDSRDVTVVIDGTPKQLAPGDSLTRTVKANGMVDIASITGGDFSIDAKFAKAPKEDKKADAPK